MNSSIGEHPPQKQSGGYKFPSPSKTARRSSKSKKSGSIGTGPAQPELHRIMSLFQ